MKHDDFLAILVGGVVGLSVLGFGVFLGRHSMLIEIKETAVKIGVAEYKITNPINGHTAFFWKTNKITNLNQK